MAAEWYCRIAGAELGPLSAQQLKSLGIDGRLRPDDEVRQGQSGKWVPANRVKGLLHESASEGSVAPVHQHGEPAGKPRAAGRSKDAMANMVVRAKAAPKPPEPPSRVVPVATVDAARPARAAAAAAPSPFVFQEPDDHRSKSAASRSGPLSAAEMATRRRKQRMKLLIGSLAALGAVIVASLVVYFVSSLNWSSEDESSPSQELAAAEQFEEGELGGGQPIDLDAIANQTHEAGTSTNTNGREELWLNASTETATAGPVSVRIVSVQVEKPRVLRPTGRAATPSEKYLVVTIELANNDPEKKVEYRGWGGKVAARQGVLISDDLGNPYKAKTFAGATIDGQQSDISLYAGEPVRDVLVFERPVDAAKDLRLQLPAAALGQNGTLRFEIPTRMIGAEPAEQEAPSSDAPMVSPEARNPQEPENGDDEGEVYQLEITEKAVDETIGMDAEPNRPADGFEALRRDNPDLFPDQ